MSRHSILSNAQREALLRAQFDLHEREVARYWTWSDQDLLRMDRRRRDSNRFGFAVQLCLLRFPGWPPNGSTLPLRSRADISWSFVSGRDPVVPFAMELILF